MNGFAMSWGSSNIKNLLHIIRIRHPQNSWHYGCLFPHSYDNFIGNLTHPHIIHVIPLLEIAYGDIKYLEFRSYME